jgi:hypothetical protein
MAVTKGGGLEEKNLISGDAVEVHRNSVSSSGSTKTVVRREDGAG